MLIRLYTTALIAAACLPSIAAASSLGPADGYAGNPPFEDNCTSCHFTHVVNSGDGALELIGLPDAYVPNQTYSLSVQLSDPEQSRWGFELTALDVNNQFAQGGQLAATDFVHTQLSEDAEGTEDYIKQTIEGTYTDSLNGPISWQFDWTAPPAAMEGVGVYLAGNAADGNFTLTNDFIYVTSIFLSPESPTPVENTTWGGIKSLYAGE